MKPTYKAFVLILFFILTGCARPIKHDYIWNEYPITPERISFRNGFNVGQEIIIIKGKSNDSKIFLGNVGQHEYYGSEQSFTDGIVYQLAKELRNQRLEIKNTADKSLEITVNRSKFERGMIMIAATLEFTVKFGNGRTAMVTAFASTPWTWTNCSTLTV